jgi:hypothetical protein
MTSPIYYHTWIYERVMRRLYSGCYEERIHDAALHIPDGCSVADICAGDCSLYRYGLIDKNINYTAYDINPRFIRWAEQRNISMRHLDIRSEDIPQVDCVVMMSALYQFIPHERDVLERMINAARKMVIITEPVRNVAQSSFAPIRWMGKILTRVQDNPCDQRFTEASFRNLVDEYGFHPIEPIANQRELLAVYSVDDSL